MRLLTYLFAVSLLGVGCGSKTGLDVPDASPDAGPDIPDVLDIPCVEVRPDGGPVDLPLETVAELRRADVAFLIDVTASMGDEIERIRDQLRDRLAPAIEAQIPDARFAVAVFGDFPVVPFGGSGDSPFLLMLGMTDDLARVQAAVNAIGLGDGQDEAESQVEALYLLATGEGFGSYVEPSFGCPGGGFGYPCFRREAVPIVLLFTDAPFHNGPSGANPYTRTITPAPHVYADAVRALQSASIRVIGLDSGDGSPRAHLRRLATDTRSVDAMGQPLVFDIGSNGQRLGVGVVDALRSFAEGVEFDVDVVLVDPDRTDGIDATAFVESIVPLRADPMDGIDSIDLMAGVFRGVVAGTTVYFQLRIRSGAVVPGPSARRFLLEVIFRGDGRTRLGRRVVAIVIPGEDGSGCEAFL